VLIIHPDAQHHLATPVRLMLFYSLPGTFRTFRVLSMIRFPILEVLGVMNNPTTLEVLNRDDITNQQDCLEMDSALVY